MPRTNCRIAGSRSAQLAMRWIGYGSMDHPSYLPGNRATLIGLVLAGPGTANFCPGKSSGRMVFANARGRSMSVSVNFGCGPAARDGFLHRGRSHT